MSKCAHCGSTDHASFKCFKKAKSVISRYKSPNRISSDRAAQTATYSKIRNGLLSDAWCQCCFPGCERNEVTIHHSEGKEGDKLFDASKFKLLCLEHHRWVEENSNEAIRMGLSSLRSV